MTLRRRAALETPRRAVRAAGLMALLATTMALPGVAAQAAVSDTALKAAFVFKFVRFTDWPARGTSTLTLCVVGDGDLGEALDATVRAQQATGAAADVRTLKGGEPLDTCDVVFVPASESRRTAAGLKAVRDLPVLTVSDALDFARTGGIIELYVDQGRLRFAINPRAADRAGLRLSSRLLALARIVEGGSDD